MKFILLKISIIVVNCCIFFCTKAQSPAVGIIGFEPLPVNSVLPDGWLRNQLDIMTKGSTGYLDEVLDKLKDNGWIQEEGYKGAELPYWLDGALPLAYLLDDRELKAKVLRYVNRVLETQRPSGYFGPFSESERKTGKAVTSSNCEDGDDWWPRMVMLKVLRQYYMATQDERVIPFMERYFHYQLNSLKQCPLSQWTDWAESRGADNALIVMWLYELTGDEKLVELAALLQDQSYPWTSWFGSRDWVIRAAAYQDYENWMSRHAVNVAMGLKAPLIDYMVSGNRCFLDTLRTGFDDLMMLHGLPMGIFSGDEDLHGNAPSQGVELCAIVEAMFSLEEIIRFTGDVHYMDALERMAFNALPAQTTDDYNAKQYYQIANQVQVDKGVFDFSLPWYRQMCNVFGMKSGYTCCMTNMHQGWTKFASRLWLRSPDKGLAAFTYSPSSVTTTIGEEQYKVTIEQQTSYPFSEDVRFVFRLEEAVSFPLHLRIPGWCEQAVISLNGLELERPAGGQVFILNEKWHDGDELLLHFPMKIAISKWGRNSRAVERGPLVYALKIGERWERGVDEEEGEYYCVYPEGKWNYGLLEEAVNDPEAHFIVKEFSPAGRDFVWNLDHSPLELRTRGKQIPNWQLVDGLARQPVNERKGTYKGEVSPETEEITLVPYGCTKVRVVAFPVVK